MIFDAIEACPATTKHVVMLTTVPVVYPNVSGVCLLASTLRDPTRSGWAQQFSVDTVLLGSMQTAQFMQAVYHAGTASGSQLLHPSRASAPSFAS